jgi:hypothetical protein
MDIEMEASPRRLFHAKYLNGTPRSVIIEAAARGAVWQRVHHGSPKVGK